MRPVEWLIMDQRFLFLDGLVADFSGFWATRMVIEGLHLFLCKLFDVVCICFLEQVILNSFEFSLILSGSQVGSSRFHAFNLGPLDAFQTI